MRAVLVDKALEAYRFLPDAAVSRALGAALGQANVALCLHRVQKTPSQLVIDPGNLDALIELLLRARVDGRRHLTVTFDDGYADAAEYVESRHARYPDVTWLVFVCPEKLTTRAGFRWDAADGDAPLDVRAENGRAELRGLGDAKASRLMTVAECHRLQKLTNVVLGNHTNTHFRHTDLSFEDSRFEIAKSREDFEALFGPTPHFAFPFGTPGSEVGPEHARSAHELGYSHVWGTEPRPYRDDESNDALLLLPRFPVVGTWPARKLALYMTIRATRWRLRGAERSQPGSPGVSS
jgi:peptidoglycan/xylan/chitin deacetylase (PgdA/CDA1 family)